MEERLHQEITKNIINEINQKIDAQFDFNNMIIIHFKKLISKLIKKIKSKIVIDTELKIHLTNFAKLWKILRDFVINCKINELINNSNIMESAFKNYKLNDKSSTNFNLPLIQNNIPVAESFALEIDEVISHYNQWLTDNIQNHIKNLDERIKFLFQPFESFSSMSCLFGLNGNYLREQRYSKNSENIIAVSKLKKMRDGFKKRISEWIELYPQFTQLLINAENDIINLIDEYKDKFRPLPSPYYQMYRHHPDFNRHYFAEILNLEQAYWLGFLLADGYIGLEHKTSGDYYRMGIGISEKDKSLLIDFCSAVGLNPDYIHTRMVKCSYTNEKIPISKIRWGDQNFAESLIKKGMNYAYNNEIGRRVKIPVIPKLKNIELMLSFLLGFYDGDGSLGLYIHKNGKKTIFPCITSSNKEFLLQIKQYFKIKYDLYRQISMKFDFKKSKIVKSKVYKLYLGTGLFKEMLKNFKESLKRKRFSIKVMEKYGISEKKEWLKNVLSKKKLIEISDVLSPWKIGERLGLDGRTIISYAVDELRINPFKEKGHYITISNSIRWNREKSEYYRKFQYWLKYLERLGKFSE